MQLYYVDKKIIVVEYFPYQPILIKLNIPL